MEQLRKDIESGQFARCYLLYGEEAYLKKQYKDRLTRAIVPDGGTMNLASFSSKDVSVPELKSLGDTMPFFAEHRLILVEDSALFKSAAGGELAEYLPGAPDSTVFLFVETEIDKRSKLYKAVKETGRIVELKKQTEEVLTRWVLGSLKKEHKQITRSTLQLFFSKTGLDMETIHQELEKLLSYCLEKPVIEAADVNAVCTAQSPDQIFEMINALAAGQTKRAIELYYDLLLNKEPPLRILALLERQFTLLLKVKDLQTLGQPTSVIQKKTGLPSFVVKRTISQASRFQLSNLKAALAVCADTESDIKTGRIADRIGVELLLVAYSR